MSVRNVSKSFEWGTAKIGLPQIGLHGLRHTHAPPSPCAPTFLKVIIERLGY